MVTTHKLILIGKLKLILLSTLLCSSILIFLSCDKDNRKMEFYWEQTKCSDPWGTGQNDTNMETSTALKEFLDLKGITPINIKFDNNSKLDVFCESCGCGTGKRIILEVLESDESEILLLGFKKV